MFRKARDAEGAAPVPWHQTFSVGIIMSLLAGYLEAYTYSLRGNVFCNGQTSNIALMMINFFRGNTAKALYYPIPILAFFFGTVFASFLRSHRFKLRWARVEMLIFALEFALLFIIGFIPQGGGDTVVNIMVTFTTAVQYEVFREARGLSYASIFCTGNLRSAAEYFYAFVGGHDRKAGAHLRPLPDDHRLLRRGRVRQRLAVDVVERALRMGRLPAAYRHHPPDGALPQGLKATPRAAGSSPQAPQSAPDGFPVRGVFLRGGVFFRAPRPATHENVWRRTKWKERRSRGGAWRFPPLRAHWAAQYGGRGRGRIWVAIVAVTLFTLLFAWALCRAAAHADRHIAETLFRRQEEALGGGAEEGGQGKAGQGDG